MTDPTDPTDASTDSADPARPADAQPDTTTSDGPLDKIKNAVGHAIGSEGKRHGARDTDPGS